MPAVGIGGVIVAARCRGLGLADRVIAKALERAGPPVLVEQPDGFVEVPQVSMWRAIRGGATFLAGRAIVHSFPF